MKNTRMFLFLIIGLLTLRLFLMATSSVFDSSESRYAAIGQNMATSGDFMVPHFWHNRVYQSFDGKPPLAFQASGLCRRVLPDALQSFAVRVPSFLSALLLLVLVGWTARTFKDAAAARRAVFYCLTSVMFFMMSGLCMTDMMLTCCVSGALLCEALFAKTCRKRWSLAVFALLGAGMLVKGPVALVLFGLPVLIYTIVFKRWDVIRRHAWFFGILLFIAISAPWYVFMARRDPDFLNYFFVHENFLRFLVHNYGDRYGGGRETFRGMAIVWTIVATLPWTLLLIPIVRAKRLTALFREPLTDFLVICVLAITGFWCLTSRVPLPYLLPVVPLFATTVALQPVPEILRRWIVPVGVVGAFILPIVLLVTGNSGKMPDAAFLDAKRQTPENARIAFRDKIPYSADFYLGSRVIHDEVPSNGDYLFIRTRNKVKSIPGRTLIFSRAGWMLFSPVVQEVPGR